MFPEAEMTGPIKITRFSGSCLLIAGYAKSRFTLEQGLFVFSEISDDHPLLSEEMLYSLVGEVLR